MTEKKINNPKRVFKEQDNLIVSRKNEPGGADKLVSIRRSELTSTAPDDINWSSIYAGKTGGLHSIKPETGYPRKKRS